MSAPTLYGSLTSELAQEYSERSAALHGHIALINAFGEFVRRFELTPHVRPTDSGSIVLTALTMRGDDHAPVLAALEKEGFRIGEAVKPVLQINDGYVTWCVPVTGASLKFFLLFYIAEDVA